MVRRLSTLLQASLALTAFSGCSGDAGRGDSTADAADLGMQVVDVGVADNGLGGDSGAIVDVGVDAPAVCGDGRREGTEACDDANASDGDGCSGACEAETGFACSGAAPTVCESLCGDGRVVTGEACDDGNATAGDGCDACRVELGFDCAGSPSVCAGGCGDGVIAAPETCDDGFRGIPNATGAGGDGCSATCALESGFACVGAPSVCTASASVVATRAITDAATASLDVTMPADCVVRSVASVTIGLQHTWVGDLTARVVAPDGAFVQLFVRPGTSGAGSGNAADLSGAYVFTDSGAVIPETGPVPAGAYRPTADGGVASSFAAFVGARANGVWRLEVRDDGAGDVGSISNLRIDLVCDPN